MSTTATALIGLDWGTTSLRASRIAAGGDVLETRSAPEGILAVVAGGFEAAFERAVGDWLDGHPGIPVVLSGMIGSRQGWREAPYVQCPAGAGAVAGAGLAWTTAAGRRLWLAPGLTCRNRDGVPDVMRGEETQILGALDEASPPTLAVLPGTHSKWARWRDGRIERFATYMTGEVFAALANHTILGRTMEGTGHDPASFARGVRYGAAPPGGRGGLLERLFSARTLALFDEVPTAGRHAYLSGLLIGAEIREARAGFAADDSSPTAPEPDPAGATAADTVTVIGEAALAERYVEALALLGIEPRLGPPAAAARGQLRLARAAGLLPETAR